MAASSSLDPCQISSSSAYTTYSTPHYISPNSTVQISGNFAPDTIIPISGEFAPDTIVPISGEFAPDTIVPISNTVGTPVRTALLMVGAAVGLIPDSIREVYLSNGANPLQEPFAGDRMIHAISDGNFPVTHNSIRGVYLRNGANPLHEPVAGHRFFAGDGMIHAISDGTSDFSPESDIESNLTVTADRWSSSVIELYNQHELGKAILGFAIPVITGLLNMHSISNPVLLNLIVVSLCIGFVCIWIGLQTRALVPRVAIRLEQFGVATVLAAFFGLVSKFVPVYLIWAPWACWALSLLPFALTLF